MCKETTKDKTIVKRSSKPILENTINKQRRILMTVMNKVYALSTKY